MSSSSSSASSPPTDRRRERHASRTIDIIVHGATGFTGRRVVRHLASRHPHLKVAICGRSRPRLEAVAAEVGWDGAKVRSSVFVVASSGDGGDDGGLAGAFSGAKVVIACAGPYRRCGLPVLGAAVRAGCDYLDLCGEPQFFDDALVAFDGEAREAGVLAVHAAAFDCVPAELGSALAERELLRVHSSSPGEGGDEGGTAVACAGIEVVHTVRGVTSANATTFHAAVDGFHAAASGELAASRRKVRESHPELFRGGASCPPPRPGSWPRVPEAPGSVVPGRNGELGLRTVRFVGADASAMRSSWRYLRSRVPDHPRRGRHVSEPRLSVVIGMDAGESVASTLKLMAYGATFSALARFRLGCKLLHSNPEAFSGGLFTSRGPTEEELQRGSFATYVTAYGSGHSDDEPQVARVRVSGPEPGYVATPSLIVALALTILEAGKGNGSEEDGVRFPFDGGVTLPGALFGDCDSAYDNMRREGVSFDVVPDFSSVHSPV